MAVTVSKEGEIEKDGIVYIPAMRVSQDSTETSRHEGKEISIPKVEYVWVDTDISAISDEEVKAKAYQIWTPSALENFKKARK